jgi:hypothetical protein
MDPEVKTTDEETKPTIAKKVIATNPSTSVVTDKKTYFVPEHGVSVEASGPEDATQQALAAKEGDA